MKIIISPAKKMREDPDNLPAQGLPRFLMRAEEILGYLQSMSYGELKKLWGCSDRLAELNIERLKKMDLRKAQTPAIFRTREYNTSTWRPEFLHKKSLTISRKICEFYPDSMVFYNPLMQ